MRSPKRPDVRLMMDAVAGILANYHVGNISLTVPKRTPRKAIRHTPYFRPGPPTSPSSKPWTIVGLARYLGDTQRADASVRGRRKSGDMTATLVGLLELLERGVINDEQLNQLAETMNFKELHDMVQLLNRATTPAAKHFCFSKSK